MNLTANEIVLIVLGVFSFVTGILGFFGTWAFLKTISLGEDVATLKAQIKDGERRFEELKTSIDKVHAELHEINGHLQEALLHWPKRHNDERS